MSNLDNDIYEFNKIDAYNKLQKAIKYFCGENKKQSFDKFMILCKMSALQNNSHSQYIMGIFYEDGIEGLEKYFQTKIEADEKYYKMTNSKKALKWYEKSANQGYKDAQYASRKYVF